MKNIIWFVLFATINCFSYAQKVPFKQYSLYEGLSQEQIMCLTQDSLGYLWIGTKNGINRFDGIKFKNHYNSKMKTSGFYYFLEVTGKNKIITTMGAFLCTYETNGETIDTLCNIGINNNIYILENKVVILFRNALENIDSIAVFNLATKEKKIKNLSLKNIYTYCAPKTGDYIYFIFKDKTIYSFNIKTFALNKINIVDGLHITVTSLSMEKDKAYYFDQGKKELLCLKNGASSVVDIHFIPKHLWSDTNRIQLFIDQEEIYLFYAVQSKKNNNGFNLIKYNRKTGNSKNFHWSILSPNCIIKDKEGVLWIGSENGLLKVVSDQIRNYSGDQLPYKQPWDVVEDKNGIIWAACYEYGLLKLQNEKFEINQEHNALHRTNFFYMGANRDKAGNIYFPLADSTTILKYDGQKFSKFHFFSQDKQIMKSVLDIFEDTLRNRMLFCGKQPYVYENNQWKMIGKVEDYQDYGYFLSVCVDKFGNYIYLNSKNLFFVNSKTYKVKKVAIPNSRMLKITSDFNGNIWIGTHEGFIFYDYKNYDGEIKIDDFTILNQKYPISVISDILKVNGKNFVTSGSLGITYWDIETFYKNGKKHIPFKHYDIADGISGLNQNAGFVDSKGNLWMADGSEHINCVEPEFFEKKNQIKPNVLFETLKFLLDNNKDSIINLKTSSYQKISLPIGNRKGINIYFNALSLVNPNLVYFTYSIPELGISWSDTSTKREISFPYLDQGTYTLQIKACNNSGIWSDVITLEIIILPYFYETYWFYLILLLLITASMLYLFIRYRNRKKEDALQKKKLAEQEKAFLVAQLSAANNIIGPHFTGNLLNNLLGLMALDDFRLASEYASEFADLNANLYISNKEILKPLSWEIEQTRKYLNLEHLRFDNIHTKWVGFENSSSYNSFMIPKSFLLTCANNAVKHGLEKNGGLVVFRLTIQEEFYFLEIIDNGLGFNQKSNQNSTKKGLETLENISHYYNSIQPETITFEIQDFKEPVKNTLLTLNGDEFIFETGTKVIFKIRKVIKTEFENS